MEDEIFDGHDADDDLPYDDMMLMLMLSQC